MNNQLSIKMILDTWYAKIKETDSIIDKLTDEEIQSEVSPGRNRGIYLLGHLIAVHDHLLSLLGFAENCYPELVEVFIKNPDKSKAITVSVADLRSQWKNVNGVLANHFDKLSADEWYQKHTSISAEDFQKEPHRNRLNVIISRTNHLSYHNGQLALLIK